jgi:predicted GNAT family N-acyltransferase
MSYELISNYQHIEMYRHSFNNLARQTFGIDFEQWYQQGFWTNRFICYSYIDQDQIIANVSISKVELILPSVGSANTSSEAGISIKALQLGTVMTAPAYRHQGLSRRLIRTVLDKYDAEYEIYFLFANQQVLNYYPKFGFQPISECLFESEINPSDYELCHNSLPNTSSSHDSSFLRKLNPSDPLDLSLIWELVSKRLPVSQRCGVNHSEGITMWYCLHAFREHIYYLGEENMLVICKQQDSTLHIFDVISRKQLPFKQWASKIIKADTNKLRWYFTPDLLDIEAKGFPADDLDILFVKQTDHTVPSQHFQQLVKLFKYPVTSQA